MIEDVKKGYTLLVRGPTRITLLEGKLEVFGKLVLPETEKSESKEYGFKEQNVLIIPGANNYPLYALENSKLEIYTNTEENLFLIKENSIPAKWIEIKDSILEIIKKNKGKKPIKIMVLGISSGKTTIIKYLANNFIREGLKGGYLDSDLGQQIMFLPTTINIGEVEGSIVSSADVHAEMTVFIGATFPKGNYKFIVSYSCKNLIDEYIEKEKDSEFILIDSDGWIKTEAGIVYKNFFIKTVDPDVLIVFHDENIEELKEIEKVSSEKKSRKIFLIEDKNNYFYEKDKEERRFLRQSQFSKKFEEFRKISIPLNDIKFIKRDYDVETEEILEREIIVEDLIHLPYHYVIIGLLTENSELINIGLLFSISIEKNYILLFSELTYKEQVKIKKILCGSLRLSTKGNHQGYLYL